MSAADVASARSVSGVRATLGSVFARLTPIFLGAVSIAAFLALWQYTSTSGLISEQDLPAMTTTFQEL